MSSVSSSTFNLLLSSNFPISGFFFFGSFSLYSFHFKSILWLSSPFLCPSPLPPNEWQQWSFCLRSRINGFVLFFCLKLKSLKMFRNKKCFTDRLSYLSPPLKYRLLCSPYHWLKFCLVITYLSLSTHVWRTHGQKAIWTDELSLLWILELFSSLRFFFQVCATPRWSW